MGFDRTRLPEPLEYFSALFPLTGKGKWRTGPCEFHGGSDSLGVNIASGGWVCRAGCGARGGDVVAYEMAAKGVDFVTAAKALGAWVDDGKETRNKPAPFSPRDAISVLAEEAMLCAVAACNVAHGRKLTEPDRFRLLTAAGRINRVAEAFK